jgi:uncharacterized protein YdeI (YjbR/CyaY-like superfamily)
MPSTIPKTKLLYVTNRTQWRAWLKKNRRRKEEVWLVYYKKSSGKPRISYNDAVEEALCFGWIDSKVKSIDQDKFAQRFSVRKPGSRYSQANLERLRALASRGRVLKDVLASIPASAHAKFRVPKDILAAIRKNKQAARNFAGFSQPYIRIRVAFIDEARERPAEFQKRLAYFLRMTEKGKQFGFGGIEKYY